MRFSPVVYGMFELLTAKLLKMSGVSLCKSKGCVSAFLSAVFLLPLLATQSSAQTEPGNIYPCHCSYFFNNNPDTDPGDIILEATPGHPNCYDFGFGVCPCPGDVITDMEIKFANEQDLKDCMDEEKVVVHKWIPDPLHPGSTMLDAGIQYSLSEVPIKTNLNPVWEGGICYSWERVLCGFKPECIGRCFPVTITFKQTNVTRGCAQYIINSRVCIGQPLTDVNSDEQTNDVNKQIISPNIIYRTGDRAVITIPQLLKKTLSEIIVFDAQGRSVYSVKQLNSNTGIVMIPTDTFSEGMYTIVFRSSNKVLRTERIVVY